MVTTSTGLCVDQVYNSVCNCTGNLKSSSCVDTADNACAGSNECSNHSSCATSTNNMYRCICIKGNYHTTYIQNITV